MKALCCIALAVWLSGCATLEYTDPGSGRSVKVNLGVKGCVSLRRVDSGELEITVEHDGMSSAFAGTIRSVFSAVASVFGGAEDLVDAPQGGEGCASSTALSERRVIGELVAPAP